MNFHIDVTVCDEPRVKVTSTRCSSDIRRLHDHIVILHLKAPANGRIGNHANAGECVLPMLNSLGALWKISLF